MNDINAIKRSNFVETKEAWLTWRERFLAKTRRSEINHILLDKVTIPKTNEEINKERDEVKFKIEISNLNELAYIE
jgi:hypothetical protein